jgi:hypothetical protein
MVSPLLSGTPPPVTKLPIVNVSSGLATLTFISFLQQLWTSLTNLTTPVTVASLPAQPYPAGARFFVSDATATTFNSVVAGGGANNVPTFSDGAAWRIG